MKNLISILVISITLVSCSTTSTFNKGPFQKRKYNKGIYINKKSNAAASNKQKEVAPLTIIKEAKEKIFTESEIQNETDDTISLYSAIENNTDSVKIVLKNGDTYIGTMIDEDENGHRIQQSDGRVVFLAKKDIEEIVPLRENKTTQKENEIKLEKTEEQYTYTLPKQTISNYRKQPANLQAPSSSKAAIILFAVTLFILIIPAIPAVLSLFSFIFGLTYSIIGYSRAKKNPSLYHVKKAKRIKWLYLAPILILLSLIGLALTLY